MVIGIRAGSRPHRMLAIWAVVVEGRVFVRSWMLKPEGWYHTFLKEPVGVMEVNGRRIAVRAIRTRSERLKNAVDLAYMEKYRTPGSLMFVRGFRQARRRNSTLELALRSATY
jgi:hypothetical protein